jgi:AcrR family transcriptional regulator
MAAVAVDPTIRREVMAAARALLAEDPAAPVGRIADRAGVSRATFYRHFGSRSALLAAVEWEPRPNARTRILEAAQEILVRSSLAQLRMDELARAAGVSRGTLYRLFPGKPALLSGLLEAYSPFATILRILADRGDQPPAVVLPMIARAVTEVAERRLGLLRVVLHEASSGSPTAIAGVRPVLEPALGALARYMATHMAAGEARPMHPLLALQAFMGPIFFHLTTRTIADEVLNLQMSSADAVEQLVAASLAGLAPDR